MTRTYTRREADEILRRAIAFETADGISHQDLVAAAREVGIPPDAIEHAAAEVGSQGEIAVRAAEIRQRRRRAFFRHFVVYGLVNAGVLAIDWLNGGPWFFYWLLISWGVVLAVLGLFQLAPDPDRLTRRAERELERDRKRAARRARQQARRAPKVTDHAGVEAAFDDAVKEGVSTLLSAATRIMRQASTAAGRYRVDGSHEDVPAADAHEEKRARSRG